MEHVHKDLMAQYALELASDHKAYKNWLISANGYEWATLISHPTWRENVFYRKDPTPFLHPKFQNFEYNKDIYTNMGNDAAINHINIRLNHLESLIKERK